MVRVAAVANVTITCRIRTGRAAVGASKIHRNEAKARLALKRRVTLCVGFDCEMKSPLVQHARKY